MHSTCPSSQKYSIPYGQLLTQANAAIGAGYLLYGSEIENLNATKCNVKTILLNSRAAIGSAEMDGSSTINNLSAKHCTVTTGDQDYEKAYSNDRRYYFDQSWKADAGIGAGRMGLETTRAVRGWINTIKNLKAESCYVHTYSHDSNCGIGVGQAFTGNIENTQVYKCNITAGGTRSGVGFGAGKADKNANVIDTIVFNSNAIVKDRSGFFHPCIGASIADCSEPSANVQGNIACKVLIKTCESASSTCNPHPRCDCIDLEGFKNGSSLRHDSCPKDSSSSLPPGLKPVTPATPIANGTTPLSTNRPFFGQRTATTTAPITPAPLSSSKTPLSSPGSAASATPPITSAPLSHSNTISTGPGSATTPPPTNAPTVSVMTPSSSVSTQFATPPLTESFSPAYIAIIVTLGTAFVVLLAVIGVYTYRNCQQRPSTSSGRNQPMERNTGRRPLTGMPLPAIPQPHLQALLLSRGDQAPVDSYPMVNTGKENKLTMNQSLLSCENKSDDYHYDEIASPRVMATGGNNSIENTGKETDQPNYRNETLPGYTFGDGEFEMMVFNPSDK